jgi:hypothetical protein
MASGNNLLKRIESNISLKPALDRAILKQFPCVIATRITSNNKKRLQREQGR